MRITVTITDPTDTFNLDSSDEIRAIMERVADVADTVELGDTETIDLFDSDSVKVGTATIETLH